MKYWPSGGWPLIYVKYWPSGGWPLIYVKYWPSGGWPLISLILPYVPYSPYTMHFSIETALLCKILEQSDHYSQRYCISKIWGIQMSSANAVWVLI